MCLSSESEKNNDNNDNGYYNKSFNMMIPTKVPTYITSDKDPAKTKFRINNPDPDPTHSFYF